MTRVLVTGAAGFVGRHVATALAARGHEVIGTSRRAEAAPGAAQWIAADLLAPGEPERVVREARADALVHLAWIATPGTYWTSPENDAWARASGELASAFVASGGTRIVGAGSCAEYDWSGEVVTAATPLAPRTPYGKAKRRAAVAMEAATGGRATFAWARIHFLFGDGEDAARFVPSLAIAFLRGARAECRAPELRREWLAVDDVAAAFATLVTAPVNGAVDVVGPERVTNGELARMIADAAGRAELLDLGHGAPRAGEPRTITGDAGALRDHWMPAQPLRARVNAYVAHLRASVTRSRPVRCAHPAEACVREFPARDYITGDAFAVSACSRCGLSVTTPVPAPGELDRYYPPGYYGDAGQRRFPAIVEWLQRALYGQRARMTERLAGGRPGRVLDIGCGRGHLLDAFRRRGWTVEGIELSDAAGAHARDVLGIPVRVGDVEAMELEPSAYDAVVLWHVLEHFPNPRGVLWQAAHALKPGGVLVVAVPNYGSVEARVARGAWFHLDVPRHLVHFTPATLGRALADVGVAVVRTSGIAPEFDAFGFTQTVENLMGLPHNLLYNVLRGRGAKVLGAPAAPGAAVAALLLAAPLGVVSVPATLVAGLAGRGGTMTVWATR